MRAIAVLTVAALVLTACGDDDTDDATTTSSTSSSTTAAPTTDSSSTTEGRATPPDPAALETVVTGLEIPWDVAFVDADTLLVTERPGRVRVVDGGELRDEPAATLDVDAAGEGGLLGIALHPEFPEQRWAYLYFTAGDGNRVSRFAVADDLALSDEEVLLDGIPSARIHDGGRLAFGPDAMLYVTTGDASEPALAADRGSLAGKILRITPDGDVPADNPFDGSPVWSYGHRNPQGLAWDDAGRLYASEHGPSGDLDLCCRDEINRIEPGRFYGWPHVAAGTETGRGDPPAEPTGPLATSGPDATWAPAGITVIGTGADAALLVTTLRGEAMLRFPIDGDGALGEPSTAVDGFGRLRIARLGPDGCLWSGTSNTDGRGDVQEGDDRLLRAC